VHNPALSVNPRVSDAWPSDPWKISIDTLISSTTIRAFGELCYERTKHPNKPGGRPSHVSGRESSDPVNFAFVIAGSAMTALTESGFPGCQPGRLCRKLPTSIAFIDPKPLTRQSIADMLATAFPDNVTIALAFARST